MSKLEITYEDYIAELNKFDKPPFRYADLTNDMKKFIIDAHDLGYSFSIIAEILNEKHNINVGRRAVGEWYNIAKR